MATIGIDLGTTNSLACVWRDGRAELIPNALGRTETPSVVSLAEDGTALVGAAARERLVTHPQRTAASFKRWMGTGQVFCLGERDFRPEDLSALVLRQLKEDAQRHLKEPVEQAVISVPAYFDDNQRSATKAAAQLAGLEVQRLINEPSAAALYHRMTHNTGDARLLIVDFGGGTLDVSIVDCFETIIEIVSIAGDNRLGGDDVDLAVAEHFCAVNGLELQTMPPWEQRALLRQAELAKRTLSHAGHSLMMQESGRGKRELLLTRPLLRQLCQPLLERVKAVMLRAVRDSGMTAGALDDVVLVGGSSQLPVLGDFLEEFMGRRPTAAGDPGALVAWGTGVCAGIRDRREELRDLVMTDVCPFSLGVATYTGTNDENPHMAVLIPRSSLLPASRSDTFYTLYDNQLALRLEIYQGEAYYAGENLKLGEVRIRVPPGPAGSQFVRVRFTYDINGILQVEAESSGGERRGAVIVNPKLRLSQEELALRLQELEQVRLTAQGAPEDRLLLERAERLYTECLGPRRQAAQQVLTLFRRALEEGGRIELEKARRWAARQLEAIEASMSSGLWSDGTAWMEPEDWER